MAFEATVAIVRDVDVLTARKTIRELARELGFVDSDAVLLATAVSEIARNILTYATRGEISFEVLRDGKRLGVAAVARDQGPGIADVERAMQDGYSTGGGLGLGLPGARRIMDEFRVESSLGAGTTIFMKKWKA